MYKKITTWVFVVMVGGLCVLNLATPVRQFSENENRYLQQWPKFSGSSLRRGQYTADIDTFVTDQFAYRDSWVGLKTLAERGLGKASANGVYFGKDGYIIEMFDTVETANWERNLGYLQAFTQSTTETFGIPVHTVLVPTTSMILRDKLPDFAPELNQAALLDQAANVPGFIDVSGTLEKHSGEYIYYRTDHHWTSLGAFYVYNAWREAKSLAPKPLEEYEQQSLSDSFYGTSYTKASLYTASPDEITAFIPKDRTPITVDYNRGENVTDSIYERSYLEQKDKYSVFLNANQAVTQISTGNKNGEKLLIVKDSYANSFVQMLLPDYEEIYVVDPRYYKESMSQFIRENGITEALVLYSFKGFSSDTNLFFLTR